MSLIAEIAEEVGNRGISKVKQYKWLMIDRPGELRMIGKLDLVINPEYQRQQSDSRVLRLAASWSWIAMGAIVVAHRNGRFFVVDGGHRVLAARRRSDIKDLPCIVFEATDVQAEATGFLSANTNRKAMSMVEKFNALLITKDKRALLVKRLCEEDDRVISGTDVKRSLKAVAAAMKWAGLDAETLERMWPVFSEITQDGVMKERIIEGLMYIETKQNTETLSKPKWRKILVAIGEKELLKACGEACAFYARGGPKVWAIGILKALNKGRREDNKIRIEEAA